MKNKILFGAVVAIILAGGFGAGYYVLQGNKPKEAIQKKAGEFKEEKVSEKVKVEVRETKGLGGEIALKESTVPLSERIDSIKKRKKEQEREEEEKKERIKVKVEEKVREVTATKEAVEQPVKVTPKPKKERNYNTKMIIFDNTTKFKSKKTVPVGTMFDVYLINNIVSNNYASPVVTGVIEPLIYNTELIVPIGSRLIGSASAGRQRDRAFVEFHTAVYPDGSTVPIGGIGMADDGSAGLKGLLVDKRGLKALAAFGADFMSAFTMMLADTYINPVTGNQEISTNTKNAVWGGIANSFQKISEDLRTAANRDDAYLVIPAGTPVKIYLTKTVDFEKKGG